MRIDLYFHVITLCSLDVTVNFWANDFQPPWKKMARTPMVNTACIVLHPAKYFVYGGVK